MASNTVNATDAVMIDFVADLKKTSFYIRLTDKPHYKNAFLLEKPNRVVVDISDLSWKVLNKVPVSGIVSKIRFGNNGKNGRIVLDLKQKGQITHFEVKEHPRAVNYYLMRIDITHDGYFEQSKKTFIEKPVPITKSQVTEKKFYSQHVFKTIRRKPRDIVVVIDPGHGGQDPGATSVSGFREKNIVLKFSQELANTINRHKNMHAILTRDKDFFIPLDERPLIASHYKPDLFISVHADALENKSFGGTTVYTVSDTASDEISAKLAESENSSDIVAGVNFINQSPEVANILIDFMRRETDIASYELAESFVMKLAHSAPLVSNPHRKAGFRVLKSPNIPSILIELGYLTNRDDERRLTNPEKRRNMIGAMIRAIDKWYNQRVLSTQ